MKFTDQINRSFELLDPPPKKIISLVPSITELLFDLGLGHRIEGVTKFCVHPESAKEEKVILGGTKNLHYSRVDEIKPDLIIANKEENTKEMIDVLSESYPVYVSDIESFESMVAMIRDVGILTNTSERADRIIKELETRKAGFSALETNLKVLYLIWKDPWMSIGSDTFIHYMLELFGLDNILGEELRYPEVNMKEVKKLQPDLVFLSSEPFPFNEKHISQVRELLPDTRIFLVDGEMFSWYGTRMLKSFSYFEIIKEEIARSTW